jgi:hypothetical protein
MEFGHVVIRRIFKLFSKSFSRPYRHVKKRDIVLMSISQRCNDLFLEQVNILSRPSLPGNTTDKSHVVQKSCCGYSLGEVYNLRTKLKHGTDKSALRCLYSKALTSMWYTVKIPLCAFQVRKMHARFILTGLWGTNKNVRIMSLNSNI